MNPDDILETVFASAHPTQWYEVLGTLLQQGHAEACALSTPMERMQAHRRHFLWYDDVVSALMTQEAQQKMLASGLRLYANGATPDAAGNTQPAISNAELLTLLRHQSGLIKHGFESNRSLRQQVRQQYRDRVLRQDLGDELCGTYPFRHAEHGIVHVSSAAALSRPSRLGIRYAYADVEPFIRASLSQEERAGLYQSRLQVQTMTADDLLSFDEQALVGQRGVFARTAIPAGVCLGVYGGQILDPVDIFLLDDFSYIFKASDEPGQICVNGETMMSLVNTRFLFDAQGEIVGHPPTGYNVEEAAFPVRLPDGREMLVHAFFSTTDIAPGTELRFCYHLGGVDGTLIFQPAQPDHATQAQAQVHQPA